MPAERFPLIQARGDHRQVGRQIGEALRPQIQRYTATLPDSMPAGVAWEEFVGQTRLYLAPTRVAYPQYTAEIEGPSGPVELWLPEGLDYARGLQADDFVRLNPGESFDPQEGKRYIPIQLLAWFKPTEPGTYRLRLRFDATADDPRLWMGQTPVRNRSKVERLIKQVPQVEVCSNTLEVECE